MASLFPHLYLLFIHRIRDFLPETIGWFRSAYNKVDSGFNAIAYSFGSFESYGYNAGTNIKDIYQYISIQNPQATVNFPATCRGTPFYFSMTFPYQPTSIQWQFGPALNAMGIADVNIPAPVPTSTTVVNGKTLYIYQLQHLM
ncbi:MAG: hypothetical protein IPK57_05700 [Chitinophagaceae bacterium]|nr:hypothetical protein [Chitinophagaceae bacterium]